MTSISDRATVTAIAGHGAVLVLAPHPDDESLGCGRLLAELWHGNAQAHVACLTDGAASHRASRTWPRVRLADLRRAELKEAVRLLGGMPERDVSWLGFPDSTLDRVHALTDDPVRAVVALVDRLKIATLVVPSPADPHCDHLAAAQIAGRVCAGWPELRVFQYSIWSRWLAFVGNVAPEKTAFRLDLPQHRAAKNAAIAAHRSQRGLVVFDDPDGFVMPLGFECFFGTSSEYYAPVAS